MINNDETKINIFEFDQINFNLGDFTSSTILVPKVQELPATNLLACSFKNFSTYDFSKYEIFKCSDTIKNEVNQEIFKRFYKPFYIPLIALLCCFLIIIPKNNYKYERNRKIVFLIIFLAIIVSEASLRYSTISNFATALYLMIPILSFILIYAIFYKKVRNV